MLTACKSKVINNTVYIPKEWNFHADEVFINKIGNVLIITPVERLAETFERGAAILASSDFMKDGRPEEFNHDYTELQRDFFDKIPPAELEADMKKYFEAHTEAFPNATKL